MRTRSFAAALILGLAWAAALLIPAALFAVGTLIYGWIMGESAIDEVAGFLPLALSYIGWGGAAGAIGGLLWPFLDWLGSPPVSRHRLDDGLHLSYAQLHGWPISDLGFVHLVPPGLAWLFSSVSQWHMPYIETCRYSAQGVIPRTVSVATV